MFENIDKETIEVWKSSRVQLEHTDIYILCHHMKECKGEFCTVHKRSDHSMRSFPQHWRADRGLMERICKHGVGHPDPDDFKIWTDPNGYEAVHGCDGCCNPMSDLYKINYGGAK